MAKTTFAEKIHKFINVNSFHVNRVHTMNAAFSMQDSIVFDFDCLERLVVPHGMHIDTDYVEEDPCTERYFLIDDDSGDYEELIPSDVFWAKYAAELYLEKALAI